MQPEQQRFVRIGNRIINLGSVTHIWASDDDLDVQIYFDDDTVKLSGSQAERFLAALERIGYYNA